MRSTDIGCSLDIAMRLHNGVTLALAGLRGDDAWEDGNDKKADV
jgi:hypothetical protein